SVIVPPPDPNLEQPRQVTDKPPLRDDTKFASSRIAVFQYSAVLILVFLLAGFWKLQIQNPQFYNERAQQNSIKSIPIIAPGARTFPRVGRVFVDNRSYSSFVLSRQTVQEEHSRPTADGRGHDYNDHPPRLKPFRPRPRYEPIIIKEELPPADLSFTDSHRDF